MTRIVEIPFDGGQDEGTAKEHLPLGTFRALQNVRLTRNGRLEPRTTFVSLSQTSLDGLGFDAQDIHAHGPALIGLGGSTALSTLRARYAAQYAGDLGSVPVSWLPLIKPQASGLAMPAITHVRDMPGAPYRMQGTDNVQIAAGDGYLCVAWNDETSDAYGHVQVMRASDGVVVLEHTFDGAGGTGFQDLRCIWCNDGFLIAALTLAFTDVEIYRFRPLTDSAISLVETHGAGAVLNDYALAAEANTVNSAYVMAIVTQAPDLQFISYTFSGGASSFVAQDLGVDAVNAYTNVSVALKNGTNQAVVVARRQSNDQVTAWTMTPSTAAIATGPTTDIMTCGAHTHSGGYGDIGVAMHGDSTLFRTLEADGASGLPRLRINQRNIAGHAGSASLNWFGSRPLTAPQLVVLDGSEGYVLFAAQYNNTTDADVARLDNAFIGHARIGNWYGPAATLDSDTGSAAPFDVFARMAWSRVAYDVSRGLYYVARYVKDNDVNSAGDDLLPRVSEFRFADPNARRQSAVIGNELFIAGGMPLVHAGNNLTECGLEAPRIRSATPSTSTGSLDSSAPYKYCACFMWRDPNGRIVRSRPSLIRDVTTGAANNTVTLVITASKGLRALSTTQNVRLEVYRVQSDAGTAGVTFHLTRAVELDFSANGFAEDQTIIDTRSDASLINQPILYTQSQTPVEHTAPPPCTYVAAGRSRLILGGLPDPTQVVFSKLLFPGEPVEFAPIGALAFSKFVDAPVTAVMALDEQYIVATAAALYRISGAGPDHSGAGEFGDPERLPGIGGCIDWRSTVETPQGYFFQAASDRLAFVDRAGAVSWVAGQAVRDTLATYPVIASAIYGRAQNCVFFACENAAGDAGATLVYDLRRDVWYVDDERFLKLVDLNGVLHGLRTTGVVAREGTGLSSAASVQTGAIKSGTLLSWQSLFKAGVRATALATSGSVTLSVDYLDGAGFEALDTHSFSGVSVGAPLTKLWAVPKTKAQVFALRVAFTGCALHSLAFEIEPRDRMARRGSGDKK